MNFEELFVDEKEITVSEYTRRLKRLIEGNVPTSWIVGEVSGLRMQGSGHVYFSLKDRGSQIPAVMFRGDASRLSIDLREGMEVVALGELSLYEPHGRYQLVVRRMRESGTGRLHQAFERLKKRLQGEGLFDSERKQALPTLPMRVAVVTSPTGAAVQDFLKILKRRGWPGLVSIFPTLVQGKGASEGIVEALLRAESVGGFDLIVVTRGGGSLEDLWSFNEEVVARAISRCRIPVVSAVGHETDFTLSDFVADVRAETPSGAAELISTLFLDTAGKIADLQVRMARQVREAYRSKWQSLSVAGRFLRTYSPQARVEHSYLRLEDLRSRFSAVLRERVLEQKNSVRALADRIRALDPCPKLVSRANELERMEGRLDHLLSKHMTLVRHRLEKVGSSLRLLGPRATLKRGFAMVESEDGSVVSSAEGISTGEVVSIVLKDGRIEAETLSEKEKDADRRGD